MCCNNLSEARFFLLWVILIILHAWQSLFWSGFQAFDGPITSVHGPSKLESIRRHFPHWVPASELLTWPHYVRFHVFLMHVILRLTCTKAQLKKNMVVSHVMTVGQDFWLRPVHVSVHVYACHLRPRRSINRATTLSSSSVNTSSKKSSNSCCASTSSTMTGKTTIQSVVLHR